MHVKHKYFSFCTVALLRLKNSEKIKISFFSIQVTLDIFLLDWERPPPGKVKVCL
jgi:hypothetical protein